MGPYISRSFPPQVKVSFCGAADIDQGWHPSVLRIGSRSRLNHKKQINPNLVIIGEQVLERLTCSRRQDDVELKSEESGEVQSLGLITEIEVEITNSQNRD